ncbi:uncharacterized protein LOC120673127 isoform X2 [Panicum virgatum]|uniref:Ubiquitin-like protease family profile domain-containing protein n=1 Tax=Panicum virgatum TaxID=38727 RepID=A0A8T0VZ71_PANVG|nr:uncharacterized protein LOC120673127 isoform X2 [Panicum virgatum]KAG2642269.1 hypothetical protein PVAP13_2KG201716 [Panicum virgatum]KAG2642271.1 hypothetical protein PVAP13_2KG201716 [Panicum virgatum]
MEDTGGPNQGKLGMSNVGDTFLDVATAADQYFKPIDMLGATRQEPHNLVQVSTEIDVQQEAEGDEGNNNGVAVTEVDHNLKSVQMLLATEDGQHARADHLNMDNQIEEGHCHRGHVQDPLEDAVKCPDHDEQMLEQISKSSSSNQENELQTMIKISQHNKPNKSNIAQVLPQDYMRTKEDLEIIEYIKSLPAKTVLVNIDSAWLNRNDMECLFNGNMQLDGKALSAYIHCIRGEKHLLCREGGMVFLENMFISSLLKRDGDRDVVLNYKEDTIDKRMESYLQADMVFIPINMAKFYWYLAVVNAKKM